MRRVLPLGAVERITASPVVGLRVRCLVNMITEDEK